MRGGSGEGGGRLGVEGEVVSGGGGGEWEGGGKWERGDGGVDRNRSWGGGGGGMSGMPGGSFKLQASVDIFLLPLPKLVT